PLKYYVSNQHLHSFPTRRSSDLNDDMNFKRIIALAVVLTTLVSCTPNNNESQSSPPVEMTKISTNNNEINQDQSNRAKNILSKKDRKSTRLNSVTFRSRMPSSA